MNKYYLTVCKDCAQDHAETVAWWLRDEDNAAVCSCGNRSDWLGVMGDFGERSKPLKTWL